MGRIVNFLNERKMKTTKYILGLFVVALFTLLAYSCKEDPIVENPSGETIIYSLRIINGDLSGGGRYDGEINEEEKTITFNNVSAETDISQVKFAGKLSLGASLDQESYDFLEGYDLSARMLEKTIQILNVENAAEYKVILNLAEPQVKPIVDKMIVLVDGQEVEASIDLDEKIINLNAPNADEVVISSLTLRPARAEFSFGTLTSDNKLLKSNPGKLQLNFLGLTDEYEIDFDKAALAGLDFSKAIIHDFSVNTTLYPDFTAELTRCADFDGEYVLLAYRMAPKVFKVSDLLNDNAANPINLDMTDVEGGTHVISSGALSHGHIYLSNLAANPSDTENGPLKVYYYDTPNSKPEVVLTFDGFDGETEITKSRFGDNISVNLDDSGNGYVYFVKQDPGDEILRFTVKDFKNFSDPFLIRPSITASYYAFYNQVGTEDAYLFTSTYVSVVQLLKSDGSPLYQIEMLKNEGSEIDPSHGTDVHIASFNKGRYLIMTSGRRFNWWPASTLYIYDISEGFDVVSSLVNYTEKHPEPVFTYAMEAPSSPACSANSAWAVVNGNLCVFTAAPHAGFALIEIPKNRE